MEADTLPEVSQGITAVPQVTQGPGSLPGTGTSWPPCLAPLLQAAQLLLKVANGLFKVGEVHPGNAHVAQGLGLARLVGQLLGTF